MNEGGQLKLARFEMFMEEMAEIDRELFHEHYEDLKLFETKYVRIFHPWCVIFIQQFNSIFNYCNRTMTKHLVQICPNYHHLKWIQH